MSTGAPLSLTSRAPLLSRFAWLRPAAISLALLVPCFWQPIVSGTDLQSHLYNAWLASLIHNGAIHGLWIGRQNTNVLVDLILTSLLTHFGPSAAERITATLLVLLCFWGAFSFISRIRGCSAWWLSPWIAILTYGFVFQMGFLNYYLASGLSFAALAILWHYGLQRQSLAAMPLLLLAYLANPLPVLWALGIAIYSHLARRMRGRIQLYLFLCGVAVLLLIRGYLLATCVTSHNLVQLFLFTGADQCLLNGWRYLPACIAFVFFAIFLLSKTENRWRALFSVHAQAFFLTAFCVAALPTLIQAPTASAAISYIADRASLLSGVLFLAVLSRTVYKPGYLIAGLVTAMLYFVPLYFGIQHQAQAEASIESLVATLPQGARVVPFADFPFQQDFGSTTPPTGRLGRLRSWVYARCCKRMADTHLLDRACIGHCFDYANYEPSTDQFRIHANPGNSIVIATTSEFSVMKSGDFRVQPSELPLYALIRCGAHPGDLVVLPMIAGDSGQSLHCPAAPRRY